MKSIQNAASRLQRRYTEVISVPNERKDEVLNRAHINTSGKSSVKVTDIEKVQIIDINIQDSRMPVIYRRPYIILQESLSETQQEAVRLLGFIDHAMIKYGFGKLAELLDNEENVG